MLLANHEGRVTPAGDKVLYVFYDFETTQNTEYTDEAKLHYLISSACNSSAQSASSWKTETACDAVRGNTRSGKILLGICLLI